MSSPDEARAYPTGDLELAMCPAYGLFTNIRFDPTVHECSSQCEQSQAFSGTFNAFAESLAERLIDRYDPRGKSILEIGCGTADFLMLSCSLADNRGIGIDPSVIPERVPEHLRDRVRLIPELFGEGHDLCDADFICCRHTLEHIGETGAFVGQVRRGITDPSRQAVVFEVPDTLRVLTEGAFWDIYYEHRSYFTCRSLARLFRAQGFDLDLLELEYDDQYIVLAARGSARPSKPCFVMEHDLPRVREAVEVFADRGREALRSWREFVDEAHRRGESVAVWGSSSKGVSFRTTLEIGDPVQCVVDINRYRQGKFMPGTGHEIVPPQALRERRPAHVVVMSSIDLDEIRVQELGVPSRVYAVDGPAPEIR